MGRAGLTPYRALDSNAIKVYTKLTKRIARPLANLWSHQKIQSGISRWLDLFPQTRSSSLLDEQAYEG